MLKRVELYTYGFKFECTIRVCMDLKICGSRKYPYPHNGGELEIPEGWNHTVS